MLPLIEWLFFVLCASVVLVRYAFMANRSYIHTLIVGRYPHLVFALGLVAMLWAMSSAKSAESLA